MKMSLIVFARCSVQLELEVMHLEQGKPPFPLITNLLFSSPSASKQNNMDSEATGAGQICL